MRVVKSLDIVNDYIEKLEKENKQLKEVIKKIVVDNLTQINIERESEFVSLILKIIQEKEEIIYKAIEYIKENTDNTNFIEVPSKELLEILGDEETPKGFKSYEDYKKKEEAFINHFCKGDKE